MTGLDVPAALTLRRARRSGERLALGDRASRDGGGCGLAQAAGRSRSRTHERNRNAHPPRDAGSPSAGRSPALRHPAKRPAPQATGVPADRRRTFFCRDPMPRRLASPRSAPRRRMTRPHRSRRVGVPGADPQRGRRQAPHRVAGDVAHDGDAYATRRDASTCASAPTSRRPHLTAPRRPRAAGSPIRPPPGLSRPPTTPAPPVRSRHRFAGAPRDRSGSPVAAGPPSCGTARD